MRAVHKLCPSRQNTWRTGLFYWRQRWFEVSTAPVLFGDFTSTHEGVHNHKRAGSFGTSLNASFTGEKDPIPHNRARHPLNRKPIMSDRVFSASGWPCKMPVLLCNWRKQSHALKLRLRFDAASACLCKTNSSHVCHTRHKIEVFN